MRACGGSVAVAVAARYYPVRSLLGAPAPSDPPQLDAQAQRARVERALGVTTTVLFLASVSYIALSALYGCLHARGAGRAARPQHPDAAATEEIKRALAEIPVVVVQVPPRDGHRDTSAGDDEEGCAVCLAGYAGGEEVRVLPACRHAFHRGCVDRWLLTRAPTCPVCRAPVAARAQGRAAKACATADDAVPPVAVVVGP